MNKKLEAWPGKCLTQVKAAHRALSYLYDGLETDSSFAHDSNGEVGFPIFDGANLSQTASALTGYCKELMGIMSSPMEGPVRLPLGAVLKLVTRCLSVTYSDVVSKPSLKELSLLLPNVYQRALDILAYLILCCGTNLLPKGKDILNACLQTLASTEKMEAQDKCDTRAHVYRVLALWLETAGLGKYYLSKVKEINRELASDIALEEKPTGTTNGASVKVFSDSSLQKKKSKGKKKGSRRVESYLESVYADSTNDNAVRQTPQNVPATVGALKVSQLVAERGHFSHFQSLLRAVLETASTLQRQPPDDLSPYADPLCRSSLYRVLLVSSTIHLDASPSSADTVHHFQVTSRALSLILQAACSDPSKQVQRLCQNLIRASKCIGTVNRPIVRKVLPEEQVEYGDVAEAERQMEDMKEENDRLKKKVLELEMDSQRHSKVMAKLKDEIDSLQGKLKKQEAEEHRKENSDNEEDSDEEEEEEQEIERMDAAEEEEDSVKEMEKEEVEAVSNCKNANRAEDTSPVFSDNWSLRMDSQNNEDGKSQKTLDHQENVDEKKAKAPDSQSEMNGKKGKKKKNKGKGKSSKRQSTEELGISLSDTSSASGQKRSGTNPSDSESTAKKVCMETLEDPQAVADVQNMLMDFVDADPDADSD